MWPGAAEECLYVAKSTHARRGPEKAVGPDFQLDSNQPTKNT